VKGSIRMVGSNGEYDGDWFGRGSQDITRGRAGFGICRGKLVCGRPFKESLCEERECRTKGRACATFCTLPGYCLVLFQAATDGRPALWYEGFLPGVENKSSTESRPNSGIASFGCRIASLSCTDPCVCRHVGRGHAHAARRGTPSGLVILTWARIRPSPPKTLGTRPRFVCR
jgi:hypothetical protein